MLKGHVAFPRSSHTFSQAPQANIQRSRFDRSSNLKTTFDAGFMVPIFVDEALPGDTFNLKVTSFARLATPIFPIMDNMYLETFFFAVPYRLVWDNWQKFNGEQIDPDDSTDYLIPQIAADADGWNEGSVADYFGIPINVPFLECSALPFRAHNLIFNEWFRDQNLQDSLPVPKGDGPDSEGVDYGLFLRGKRHDYFTSCLPWPQKGPSVELPLGSTAPVIGIDATPQVFTVADSTLRDLYLPSGSSASVTATGSGASTSNLRFGEQTGLVTDLATATAATINSIRQAFQIQKLLERDARGGTRYTEIVRAHFGVISPDARLQRPEYLGGGSSPVVVNPVMQTSSTDGTSPQGNLAAFGTCVGHGHGFVKSFTEHCIILGYASVRADLNYQQGLNRMWSRKTRYDFYWPALSHIGEQAVLNKEIYCQGPGVIDPSTGEPYDEGVFGYQERYAEYRYKPSLVTGLFRSQASGTLDSWHLAQDFSSLPVLGGDFIKEYPPVDRCIAVPSEPHFKYDAAFHLTCVRPMPMYSVPGFVDHF